MTLIEEYLADLERRLSKSLAPEVVEARLREVKAHLLAATAEDCEELAIRRFGPPVLTAQAIVRQARGFETRSHVSLSLWSGIALAAAFVITGLWVEQAMTETALQVSVWVPFLVILLFARRCFQTRRWLTLPVSAWAVLGFAIIFVAMSFPPPLDPARSAERIKSTRQLLATWDRDAREVEAWRGGHTPTDSAPILTWSATTVYIPGLPIGIKTSPTPIYEIDRSMSHVVRPSEEWEANGEGWARTVEQNRKGMAVELAALESGRSRSVPPVEDRITLWLAGSGEIIAILAITNALALGFGRFRDWWLKRAHIGSKRRRLSA